MHSMNQRVFIAAVGLCVLAVDAGRMAEPQASLVALWSRIALFGPTLAAQQSGEPAMRRALEQVNAQVNAAFQKRDVRACEALIAADFVGVVGEASGSRARRRGEITAPRRWADGRRSCVNPF